MLIIRFAYTTSTLETDVEFTTSLSFELSKEISETWDYEKRDYFRLIELHINWKYVLKSIDKWFYTLIQNWSEYDILWKYQCIKISLKTFWENHHLILKAMTKFKRRLTQWIRLLNDIENINFES